jgi:hypothetical protein
MVGPDAVSYSAACAATPDGELTSGHANDPNPVGSEQLPCFEVGVRRHGDPVTIFERNPKIATSRNLGSDDGCLKETQCRS